jgi:hypothetical protein
VDQGGSENERQRRKRHDYAVFDRNVGPYDSGSSGYFLGIIKEDLR